MDLDSPNGFKIPVDMIDLVLENNDGPVSSNINLYCTSIILNEFNVLSFAHHS